MDFKFFYKNMSGRNILLFLTILLSLLFISLPYPVIGGTNGVTIDSPVEKNAIDSPAEKNAVISPELAVAQTNTDKQDDKKEVTDKQAEGIILERPVEKSEIPLPEIKTAEVKKTPVPNKQDNISLKPESPFTREKIVEVDIEGNQYVSSQEIMSVITIKPGDTMSTEQLQKDLQGIFDMGYFTDVKFDPEITEDGIKVVFRVLENPKVKSIQFKGNELISSKELLDLMQTRVGQIFNSTRFEKDLKAINDYYAQDLGMTGVPTHIADLSTPEPGVFVLTVVEGLKVTGIDFSGNTAISSDELKKVISTKPGDYLNIISVYRDLASISKLYDEKGLVTDQPLTQETSPSGVVTYIITEARVEKFVVSGNTKTKDEVILRELKKLKEGDIINKKLLSEDIQRINNLQYFDEVNVVPKPTGKPGYFILEIQVKEGKTGLATAGVGFSGGPANSGVTGSLTLSEKNLFGSGRSVQLVLQRGGDVSNYNVNYLEPYLTDSGTSLGVNVFHSDFGLQRQPVYNVAGQTYALYTDKRTGAILTFGQPITDEFRLYAGVNISSIDTFSTPSSDNPVLATNTGTGDIRSLTFSGLYDTRDNYMDAHAGLFSSFAVSHAGWLGGDFNFSKYTVDARKFFPVGDHTLAFRFMGGSSSGSVPLSEQFYLGGNDTLRAYDQGELLGDRVVLFQAEYRFPILKSKILQGAVFFDAGNATYGTSVQGLLDNIKTDEGVGFRVAVPALGIGAVRVDYAFKNQGGGSRIVIGIGQTF